MAARLLGAGGQGALSLYTNFIVFSTLILGAGLPTGLVHFIAAKQIDKQRILPVLLIFLLAGLVGLSLFILLFHPASILRILLPVQLLENKIWIWLLITHLLFVLLNLFMNSILQAEGHFKQSSRIQIIGSLFLLIFYTLKFAEIISVQVAPFFWLLGSLLLSQVIQCILIIRLLLKKEPVYFQWRPGGIKLLYPLFHFAGIAFMTNLIQFFSYKMDIWFVHYFHGSEQTGIYSLGVSLAQMLWLLPGAVQSVLFAFISTHKDLFLNKQKAIQVTRQLAIYALLAGLTAYVLAVYFVPLLFGTLFQPSVSCIGILLLGISPFCLTMGVSAYFAATGRVRYNLYSALIGFVICLVADLSREQISQANTV